MSGRPRESAPVSSRRIPSTIRKREQRGRKITASPSRVQSRVRSSLTRRISRSPRPIRKSVFPRTPIKRHRSLSPTRIGNRKIREDFTFTLKRPRDTSNTRLQSTRNNSPDKKYLEKPYEESEKEVSYTKDDLKKITKSISRDFPEDNKHINLIVLNPENVAVPRRPGEGSVPIFDRQEIIVNKRKNEEYDLGATDTDWLYSEPSTSFGDNHRGRDYYSDKEKDRILNNSRRSPREYDYKSSRENKSREDASHHQSTLKMRRSRSHELYRNHQSERKEDINRYRDINRFRRRSLERDRRSAERSFRRHESLGESKRRLDHFTEYENRKARYSARKDVETSHHRDHDTYYHRDHDTPRHRDFDTPRHRDPDTPRHRDPDTPRHRDPDTLRHRDSNTPRKDHEYSSRDRFSSTDDSSKSQGHYDTGGRESSSSFSRGRGSFFYSRGRGVSGRPFIRNAGFVGRPVVPVRVIRGLPTIRGPIIGGRLPFPPRFLRPVIQFITPVRPRGFPSM